MIMENQFADVVLHGQPVEPASYPQVSYDPDGDCIQFLISNESYYAKRIDCLTTIYYGQESNEIVGSLIKGVRKFLHQVLRLTPGFKVDIHDGRIRLEHIFTAKLWSEKTEEGAPEVFIYRILREKAEKARTEVELGDLAPV